MVGQAALVGNAILFGQYTGDGFLVFVQVLPYIGAAAPIPAHRVLYVEHIPQATAVLPGVRQGDTLTPSPHDPAHAFIPYIVAGAGRGLRALGVDEHLLDVRVFVEPAHGA